MFAQDPVSRTRIVSNCVAVFALLAVAVLPFRVLAQGGQAPLCKLGCVTYGVSVTPDDADWGTAKAFTGGHVTTFAVTNTGNTTDTYNIGCDGTNVSCTGTSRATVTLEGGATEEIDAYFTTGAQGSGAISLGAASTNDLHNAADDGSYVVTITAPIGAPIVDASPYNFDDQDYGRCAQACFAAVLSLGTVPYFSMDSPRNVTLVYNGDRVNPKPFVHVNVTPDLSHPGTPSEYRLQVKVNGAFVTFLNGEQALRFAYPGTASARLGGQFDASSYTSGTVYPMDILVSAKYGDSILTNDVVTRLTVVNEVSSPIARGWTVAGVERLYSQADGSALITSGDGSAVYFQSSGGVFITPAGSFSKLISGIPGGGSGWTLLSADSTKVVFDATGRMTRIFDRFGNTTNVIYDASLRPWKIQDPTHTQQAPREIVLTYGVNGLSSIADPFSRTTSVTVDASHLLTVFQDPGGGSKRFSYDATQRLKSITDRGGYADTLTYDSQSGKVSAIKSPPDTGLFGEAGPVALVATLASWQKVSVPYALTAGTPFITVLADSVRAFTIDPGSDTTRFTVDRWGQRLKTIDALGRVTTVTYNASGLPARVIGPNGGVDSLDYNGDGLVTFSKAAGLPATYSRYNTWAIADSVWGTGTPTIRAFVSAGKVDSVRLGGAYVTHFTYDTHGRILTTVDPLGHLLGKESYAGQNENHSRDSLPGGRISTLGYDIYGRQTTTTQTGLPTHTIDHDLLNRVTAAHDGIYATPVRFEYDSLSLRAVVDSKGQRYEFGRDATGNLVGRTDPLGRSDLYAFDRHGMLRRWTNRRGQTTTYAYDAIHRLVNRSSQGEPPDSFFFSFDDRVVTAKNALATDTRYLDIAGRSDSIRTTLSGLVFWQRFAFSTTGSLDSVWGSKPGGTFRTRHYSYNPTLLTLDSLRFGPGWTQFVPNGDQLAVMTMFANGDTIYRDFTSIHGVTSMVWGQPGRGRSFGYDTVGRMVKRLQHDSYFSWGSLYGYDALGRLIVDSVVTGGGYFGGCIYDSDFGFICPQPGPGWQTTQVNTFTYDSVGNRTDHGAMYLPGSNRLNGFDTCAYATDEDGNVISRLCPQGDSARFYWSADNRLDSLWASHLDTIWENTTLRVRYTDHFAYDAFGRLAQSGRGYLLWNGSKLFAILDATGTEGVEYSFLNGLDNLNASASTSDTATEYNYSEPDGSVSPNHDAWGEPPAGGEPFAPRWKGALYVPDAEGLYYMRARWYEPRTGRFLSEDPIGLAGGINPYSFGSDDPVNSRDPSGLCHYGIPHKDDPPGTKCPPFPLAPISVTAPESACGGDDDYDPFLDAICRMSQPGMDCDYPGNNGLNGQVPCDAYFNSTNDPRIGQDVAGYLTGRGPSSNALQDAALGFWARRTLQYCQFWMRLTCLGEIEQWTLGRIQEPPVFEPADALTVEEEGEGGSIIRGIVNSLRLIGTGSTELMPIFCLCTPATLRIMNGHLRDPI